MVLAFIKTSPISKSQALGILLFEILEFYGKTTYYKNLLIDTKAKR